MNILTDDRLQMEIDLDAHLRAAGMGSVHGPVLRELRALRAALRGLFVDHDDAAATWLAEYLALTTEVGREKGTVRQRSSRRVL